MNDKRGMIYVTCCLWDERSEHRGEMLEDAIPDEATGEQERREIEAKQNR